MNFKKTWKRFFSLSRRSDGFTLVELIVVIAILAILGGVAVPAYSGYVEKANKQADMTLASEVAQALSLHYYRSGGEGGGYVVLGASHRADEFGDAAMKAAFGENWREAVELKYDGWTDGGVLNYVLENADSAANIADSTFVQKSNVGEMLDTVKSLTSAATNVVNTSSDPTAAFTNLLGNEFNTKLDSYGYSTSDPEYATTASNLMAMQIASEFNGLSDDDKAKVLQGHGADVGLSTASQLSMTYATLYAYSQIDDVGATKFAELNTALNNAHSADNATDAILGAFGSITSDTAFMEKYSAYAMDQGMKDMQAFVDVMGAVDNFSGSYADNKEAMADANLYQSDGITNQMNNYINAVKAVGAVGGTLPSIGEGQIMIVISANGQVSSAPSDAYLAGE